MLKTFFSYTIFFSLLITSIVGADEKPVLRVLTYNIHHGEGMDGKFDYERLARIIRSVTPDVVALQEVDKKTERADGIDQAAHLAALTGMEYAYGRAMYYSGGEYGEAILSRFPLSEPKGHPLPFTAGKEPRGMLVATVHPDNGIPVFLFANTHLCHISEELRTDQATHINALLPRDGTLPVILTGDLNARKGSATMDTLLQERWIDATKAISKIDYILLRPQDPWTIIEIKNIDEKVASDHLPVLAVLQWNG
jgi:endonuclease/exonuclease/phosphatase family metal-dependent hydrolase